MHRSEVVCYVPDVISKTRGAVSTVSPVPDLKGPPTINKETLEDILENAKGPVDTHHKWVQFANAVSSIPNWSEEPM